VLLISTHTWSNLNPNEQQWVLQAARESVKEQRKYWKEAQQKALEKIREAGVEVVYPDKRPFRESVQSVYTYFRNANPEIYHLAEEIQNTEVHVSDSLQISQK
jgi:TRAP-type C4-dicarboxylate transport system substrate-binding protein